MSGISILAEGDMVQPNGNVPRTPLFQICGKLPTERTGRLSPSDMMMEAYIFFLSKGGKKYFFCLKVMPRIPLCTLRLSASVEPTRYVANSAKRATPAPSPIPTSCPARSFGDYSG